ncbi:hypothetical protein GUITHDRAFT_101104 [Guillardia theta CCMP2712]|uniref:NADH dehydrogenase [ubiquinone] 1 alpha subcomplex subunit 12 n=1 Tax=Guillardia theta (strain CCMP2712) TaxID=905079 RepID=L1JYG7_GUITC|nr:hypothetical protein GUITHDRAFT_101104 [Guillardia theta CCMP2712]EKX53402.1 hypothetical protein GUITHDRAFT_101104 [Guillardia theta CCMP2712]|eukprot:XP_005840382.1 hypothetical protein GUITHDRAFT_101104 [Guillardia theta CCMP2712]
MDFSDLILAVTGGVPAMNNLPVRSAYSIATQLKSIRSLWINDMKIQRRCTRTGFVGMFDRMMGKKMVGKDRDGNTYWEIWNPHGKFNPRREIRYAKPLEDVEFHEVIPEWRLWLRHIKKFPPTDEEIERGERERAETLRKAREIEAEDARLESLWELRNPDYQPSSSRKSGLDRLLEHHRSRHQPNAASGPGKGVRYVEEYDPFS